MFVIYNLEKEEKQLTLGGQDRNLADVCRAGSRTKLTQQSLS